MKLYVGNLSFDTPESKLREMFEDGRDLTVNEAKAREPRSGGGGGGGGRW
mgnify:CR=1 FL=1